MSNQPSKPRVGLLALTMELYETLVPDLRPEREKWVRDAVLPALSSIAEVVFQAAVFRREDIETAIRHLEHEAVDVLLVVCLSYSPSQVALPALRQSRLPIVVWNTQELFAVDEDLVGDVLTANHGVHGTQDLCNVLVRSGVRFEYVTGHLDDPDVLDRLSDVLVPASAVSRLRRARLGLMGYPFPGMGDLGLDTTHMAATLGCEWTSLAVEDFNRRAAEMEVEDVNQLVDEYRQEYQLVGDVNDEDLDITARAELALRSVVSDYELDAVAYQFLAFGDDERTMTIPFVGASRLMAEGIGFGGEGDLIGAANTWLLNQLQSPATFSEMFTIDFRNNALLMSHMGEANAAMARDGKIPLAVRSNGLIRARGRQMSLVVSLRPGPATLCCLTLGPAGRWRFVISRVEIEDFGPLPTLVVPHFKLRILQDDVRDWLTDYAKLGGAHHNALCFGDATARIRAAAGLLDAECYEV
jgi:L-arabinose isomerase